MFLIVCTFLEIYHLPGTALAQLGPNHAHLGLTLTTFSSIGPCFARKYVYILHGTLKNTCVFATYAHRCAKTLEKTRENHARVHSKSLLCSLVRSKTCAGALKATMGSQGQSKTPRKLEKTMRRCTQSHFGLICAFKNTAQVHSKSLSAHTGSHFARKYAYILHGTLNNTCVFATYSHGTLKNMCVFSLLLSIGAYDFVCGALVCSIMHIFCMGSSKHTRVFITLCISGNCFVCGAWPQICIYSTWDPEKHVRFQYCCVFVYTFLSVGPCFAHKYANILHGTLEKVCSFNAVHIHGGIQTSVLCIFVSLVKYQRKLHLPTFSHTFRNHLYHIQAKTHDLQYF